MERERLSPHTGNRFSQNAHRLGVCPGEAGGFRENLFPGGGWQKGIPVLVRQHMDISGINVPGAARDQSQYF